ncbi:alpha-amylase [Enterococcus saigonensis]|uniref:Alpha-amylase n=1 Tax=Enterococcus saigonensis TaxID=1805431 RepID=A0A679ILQ5_9ENTE|nr:alpha-glucosidase [Enterococcus saigonensis]BCA86206.1 alpha-amylase [Enterococcus saigonensis]
MKFDREWWKEAVVYQIYPRSFKDANQDGIGDLLGIKESLPYLKNLGVDVLWLSPVYKSPMIDGGYDIADYQDIDPMFGTMEDMDALIATADKMDMKILMDLVVNHTSDQHPWFQEALKNPKSSYRNWYIFREGRNGQPPNNWRSYFGGSVWEKVPGEENMYYFHCFAKEQPDLNWENSDVRQAIIDMINWWLEKGLGGFRIDAILNLKKTITYGNFPADGEDGLCWVGRYILNQPGILDWLQELDHKTFRAHNSFTVAEADVPFEQLKDYIGEDGVFRMVFDFSYTDIDVPETGEWHQQSNWSVADLKKAIFNNEVITQQVGWGAKYLENHDQPRSINKYIPSADISNTSKKMLGTLFMMLHGTPFIYQGQEIGMENIWMDSLTDYDDLATLDQYERAIQAKVTPEDAFYGLFKRSRDNSRTPMQWNNQPFAGFTQGETTWLKVNPNYSKINVEIEDSDSESVLNHYRRLIALRRDPIYRDVVIYGKFIPCESSMHTIVYERQLEEKKIIVAVNFSNKQQQIEISQEYRHLLLNNYPDIDLIKDNLSLEAYQSIILSNY